MSDSALEAAAVERALALGLVAPTAEPKDTGLTAADRVGAVCGLTVGLLHNRKRNGDLLLADIGRMLQERHGVAALYPIAKFHYSRRATPEILDELAKNCDVAVTAIGD